MFCAYLRKSRADEVREKIEDGYDALSHHRAILEGLAERMQVDIARWYSDGIKSGASIANRDGMTQLLQDVRSGMWEGVLVTEVERLTRGDLVDQGTVMQAFSDSSTLIVTPQKVYDPSSEADMEYFEFGLFMSRREFKTINKRLVAGRLASVKEGQFIARVPPFGYDKAKIDGMKTLVPNDDARFVVRAFEMFVEGMSYREIATALDAMGAKTPAGYWIPTTVRRMVMNPVYIGKVYWNATKQDVRWEDGRRRYKTVSNPDMLLVVGLHPAIVSQELWDKAQKRVDAAPVRGEYEQRNPYGRVLVCAECGRAMKRVGGSHPGSEPLYLHRSGAGITCKMKGCRASVLDAEVTSALEEVADSLEAVVESEAGGDPRGAVADCLAEAEQARKAIEANFDRMERGIISEDDFVGRRKVLEARIAASEAEADRLLSMGAEAMSERALRVRDLIRFIGDSSLPVEDRRHAIWGNIERIEYRNNGTQGHDDIHLDIYLR